MFSVFPGGGQGRPAAVCRRCAVVMSVDGGARASYTSAMKKWTILEQVKTPDGSTMALCEHDGDYVLRVNGRELMSTRHYASEVKLAEVACEHVRRIKGARVLVGGLGFGFTLRAA